ncbi:MAG: hypothetical protein ACPHAS_06530 [Synechococcus sp.]
MPIRVELCHIDAKRVVVRASAWRNGEEVASAFGEAESVEDAEDRARARLPGEQVHPVVQAAASPAASIESSATEPVAAATVRRSPEKPSATSPAPAVQPKPAVQPELAEPAPPSEAPTDPDDWSEELAAIDLEVRRLGWDRDLERVYLERAFGHGSRHRLTRYSDLVAFLRQLKGLPEGAQPDSAPVPIRRSDLLDQGNQMLEALGWSSDQARDFLKQHLNANSRQQLSDEQLLQFNMLLEEQTLTPKK